MIQKQSPQARALGKPAASYGALLATIIAGSLVALISIYPISVDAIWPFIGAQAADEGEAPLLHNPEKADFLSAAINIDPNPDKGDNGLEMTSGSALLPSGSPDGSLPATGGSSNASISLYQVREGDSLSEISDMFGVSVNTILWANDIKDAKTIQPGDTLLILPVSGVQHKVVKGETLAGIAKKYDADADEIGLYNGISAVTAGETIIIPGGGLAPAPKAAKKSSGSSGAAVTKTALPALTGYFGNPLPGAYKSQGIHGNNGVDLAGMPKGSPVLAAAAGTVIVAKNDGGYNGGYGNYVVVTHDNGTQTLYGHLSSVSVSVGQSVAKGEKLGGVGNTGKSTGIHLHFEVRGAKNPI